MKKKILSIILALVMIAGMIPLGTMTALADGSHTHDGIDFTTPISNFNDLKTLFSNGGSGYLTADIDCTEALGIFLASKPVSLCLNDKVLNLKGKGFILVHSGTTFNLYDCGKTEHAGYIDANGLWHLGTPSGGENVKNITGGIITGGNSSSNGGGVNVNGGSFTMNGGSIAGNTASAYGGGVYVNVGDVYVNVGGNFMMNGGSITGNTAYNGGGVCVYGSFTMNGGSITGNTASKYGGGIQNNGTLKLLAGKEKSIEITGNTAGKAGGVYNWDEMHLSGKVIIKDNVCTGGTDYPANLMIISLGASKLITIDGALTGSEIYVTHALDSNDQHNTGVLTSGYTTKNPGAKVNDFFHYDGPSTFYMALESNELKVKEVPAGSYAISIPSIVGGVVTADKQIAAKDVTVTLTVTPDAGYQLKAGSLKATYDDGETKTITPEKVQGNEYTFTMPAYAVTVSAEFEETPAHTHDMGTDDKSGSTTITATKAAPFSYEIVIPESVTEITAAGVYQVGQAKVKNVVSATDNTVISYTATTTDFKCEGVDDLPAAYYTEEAATNAFPTAAVTVYENKADATSIPTMWVKIADSDWSAAAAGTYTATVTFNFVAEEADTSIKYMDWDSENKKLVEKPVPNDAIEVTNETATLDAGKFYVVKGEDVQTGPLTVSGTTDNPTTLILMDGAKLTVTGTDEDAGIRVNSNKALVITGQSGGTGNLTATGDTGGAGIGGGGGGNCGNVTINGGTVTANGGQFGAGIGGGNYGNGGTVTINGGTVTATGKNGSEAIGKGNGDRGSGTVTFGEGSFTVKAGDAAPGSETNTTNYASNHGAVYVKIEVVTNPA